MRGNQLRRHKNAALVCESDSWWTKDGLTLRLKRNLPEDQTQNSSSLQDTRLHSDQPGTEHPVHLRWFMRHRLRYRLFDEKYRK